MTPNQNRIHNLISSTLLCFVGLFLIGFKLWTNKYFGKISVDQALTTIMFNIQGSITGDAAFTRRFLQWCVYWPAAVTITLNLLAPVRFMRRLNFIFLGIGVILVGHQYQITSYIKQHFSHQQDYFATNYVAPETVDIHAKQPKNLVLIYVESLETTYSNTDLFEHDLLASLKNLPAHQISYKYYQQMPGTEWSIAGIIATQCAVPLKLITMFGDNKFGQQVSHILPSARCLGDILADNGYKNIYMNGSDLDFGGVGKFFLDHHYSELYGRKEWQRHPNISASEISGWGLHDDTLLDQAKIKLAALIKSNHRFNLTIFTIDTHGPNGHLNKRCAGKNTKDFAGIVECSANEIADFVKYAKRMGWLKNMNIVIIGDHLAMQNPVYKKITSVKDRYIFNMIISDEVLQKNTDNIIHFDLLPTILSSIGFQYRGSQLGLGYSAIGRTHLRRPAQSLTELKTNITLPSNRYNQLWNDTSDNNA